MNNKEDLKKQIIYRSTHRGTKEMDILLGSFVKKYIENLDLKELNDLIELLFFDDELLYNWYFKNVESNSIPKTKVSLLFKNYKI